MKKLMLKTNSKIWKNKLDKIYLPQPNSELIVPQDDSYLSKKIIDLSKYKKQKKVGTLFKDYNLDQIENMQISKQADIMTLFYLLEDKFTKGIKLANWNYYEPKTLHDSSLSFGIHSILASDIGNSELAYDMFEKASDIDMGQYMKSSDAGVHTASMGGLWQAVVCGFGGVRMLDGKLRIDTRLPEQWKKLEYSIFWHGYKLDINITKNSISIINENYTEDIELSVNDLQQVLKDRLFIKY